MARRPQRGTRSGIRGWGPSWVPTVSVGEDDELILGRTVTRLEDSLLGVMASGSPCSMPSGSTHTEG